MYSKVEGRHTAEWCEVTHLGAARTTRLRVSMQEHIRVEIHDQLDLAVT